MNKGPRIRFGIRWDDGRRPKRWSITAAVATALAATAAAPAAQAKPMPFAPKPVDVVVVAEAGQTQAAIRLTKRLGGTVTQRLSIVNGFTARIPARSIKRVRLSRAVKTLSRDAGMRLHSNSGSGSDKASAWGNLLRSALNSSSLSGHNFDGAGVDVAVLDSGVLAVGNLAGPGKVYRGPDFSVESRIRNLNGLDTFGHGTHVAGVVAGRDPLTGVEGVAPGARVVSVKVAGADGATSLSQVLLAMDWIYKNRRENGLRIRVLNMSLGVVEPEGYRRAPLAWAAERLWDSGIAVVAAAGNDGANAQGLDLPAADPFVIAVGATDSNGTADPSDDRVADYSSRSSVRPPDVVAPGSGVVSLRVPGSTLDEEFPGARVGEKYFRGSGTSQAAAVVSGLAARLIGQRPDLTPDQLKYILRAGAVDLPDPVSADGAGRVDAGRSAAIRTPSERDARQDWAPAILDTRAFNQHDYDARDRDRDDDDHEREARSGRDEVEAGSAEWSGRRWSGRRWSGMKWSGMKWSGMKWSGMKWSGAEWVADETG